MTLKKESKKIQYFFQFQFYWILDCYLILMVDKCFILTCLEIVALNIINGNFLDVYLLFVNEILKVMESENLHIFPERLRVDIRLVLPSLSFETLKRNINTIVSQRPMDSEQKVVSFRGIVTYIEDPYHVRYQSYYACNNDNCRNQTHMTVCYTPYGKKGLV